MLCDVGGTNIRFATIKEPAGGIENYRSYKCLAFDNFTKALQHYHEQFPANRLFLCAAGPINGGEIKLVNGSWPLVLSQAKKELGFVEVMAINDVAAIACALPKLTSDDVRKISCSLGQEFGDAKGDTKVVIAPGSGLGVSALVEYNGMYKAIATEGGHTSARSFDDLDVKVINLLQNKYGHVSIERLVSGMGIVNMFNSLHVLDGRSAPDLSAEQITERAKQGCQYSKKTYSKFSQHLGSFCGDVALLYGATAGVYLAGDLLEKLDGLFDEQLFRNSFIAKGRFENYLHEVPTFKIQHPYPALLGLQAWQLS